MERSQERSQEQSQEQPSENSQKRQRNKNKTCKLQDKAMSKAIFFEKYMHKLGHGGKYEVISKKSRIIVQVIPRIVHEEDSD